jgi:ribosomal protein S18 acetylase RimI-like enzyme
MLPKLPHRIVTKKFLSIDDVSAIQRLAALCERYEHTRLRISWGMLQTRPGDFPLDFLYYDDGKIVGYIALDDRGVETKELFGMVHPAYRRQGIFQSLFEAALDTCRSRGVKRLVLVCERASPSGQAFVKSLGATYDFSEHEMVLTDFSPRGQFDDRLSVRVAGVQDIEALVFVQSAAFNDPEAVVRRRITRFMMNPLCRYYLVSIPFRSVCREENLDHGENAPMPTVPHDMNASSGMASKKSNKITLGEESVGCEEPVGSLRLELDDEIGIYAFGIHPAYRGRGYGRQMAEEVIHRIRADPATSQKAVMLDVEIDNIHALSLYHSCGFQIRATYDYYNCYIRS